MKLLNQVNNTYYKNMSDAQICKFIWAVVEEERTRNQVAKAVQYWNAFDAIFEYKTKTEDQRVEIQRLEEEVRKNRVEILKNRCEIVEMEQDLIDREDENAMMVDQLAAPLRAEAIQDYPVTGLFYRMDSLEEQLEDLKEMVAEL